MRLQLAKYTFSHGMNFATHMFPYGISDSAWFQMKVGLWGVGVGTVCGLCEVLSEGLYGFEWVKGVAEAVPVVKPERPAHVARWAPYPASSLTSHLLTTKPPLPACRPGPDHASERRRRGTLPSAEDLGVLSPAV